MAGIPSSFRPCDQAAHVLVKASWRELTDDWKPWRDVGPFALSVRCKACWSHLIVFAPGDSASSPKQGTGAIVRLSPGAPFQVGAPKPDDVGALTPPLGAPAGVLEE